MGAFQRNVPVIGDRFGRLVICAIAEPDNHSKARVVVKCDCGNEKIVQRYNLVAGLTLSCGCLQKERASAAQWRHGDTVGAKRSAEHVVWSTMLQRCLNPNNHKFPEYGGRGIRVCARWQESFENFLQDMGRRPSPRHTIDRKNNDGDYEPENCRWATPSEQARNRRTNHRIEFRGETRSLVEWAEFLGIPAQRIRNRIKRGWSIEDALR